MSKLFLASVYLLFAAFLPYGFSFSLRTSCLSTQLGIRTKNRQLALSTQTEIVSDKVNLLHDNILVKLDVSKDSTSGGILLSDAAKDKVREGKAVSVGPGRIHTDSGLLQAISVKEGENIAFGQYAGTELSFNGFAHQIVAETDVLYKYTIPTDVTTFECLLDNVLVKLDKEQSSTSGGILVSQGQQQKKTSTGTVVKVGPGRKTPAQQLIPMPVAALDKVTFREYAGSDIKINGTRFVVLKASDIVAKI